MNSGRYFLVNSIAERPLVAVDRKYGELAEPALFGRVFRDNESAVLVRRVIAVGPFVAADAGTIGDLRVGRSGVEKEMERILALWQTIETQSAIVQGGAMFELPMTSAKIKQM